MRLRDDVLGEYHDESNYSYINVGETLERGEAIKYLKLDKLIHSYYNPQKPTELYYDYEKIYAAVTEQVATQWERTTAVPLNQLPSSEEHDEQPIAERLGLRNGDRLRYDEQSGRLSIRGALDAETRRRLLDAASISDYWRALEQLVRSTGKPNWGGFESIPLASLPDGVSIPKELSSRLQYDPIVSVLNAYDRISRDDVRQLIGMTPEADYLEAIEELHRRSRQTSTLFIGGGGFIFPRWIEAEFPHGSTIDVAELDPAVKRAVQLEMGLPEDDQTAIDTFLGDARNFIDDRLRSNRALRNEQQSPRLYDFIYGDAFNDFSVPWHLTTLEFTRKVDELLDPEDGVYLVNIIDLYPRTETPSARRGHGESLYAGSLPEGLVRGVVSGNQWVSASSSFKGLQIRQESVRRYRLRYEGVMPESTLQALRKLAPENSSFISSIEGLYDQTQERLKFSGRIPDELLPKRDNLAPWQTSPPPFESLELYRNLDLDAYWEDNLLTIGEEAPESEPQEKPPLYTALGFRGAMSEEMRQQLLAVEPDNREFGLAVEDLFRRSREERAGRFLGAYVNTVSQVFPNVYVFSTTAGAPENTRDTFVVVCSRKRLELQHLNRTSDYWKQGPFAWMETNPRTGEQLLFGQMDSVLAMSHGLVLTDDFAPVDHLLAPIFAER